MTNTKTMRKGKAMLSVILAAAVAALLLAAFPVAVSADAGSDDYGWMDLKTAEGDKTVNLNATGDDAKGDGWSWDSATNTLTLTKSINSINFTAKTDSSHEIMPNVPKSVSVKYSGNITIPNDIFSHQIGLLVEGTGKNGDLLTVNSIETYNSNITLLNANVLIKSTDDKYEYNESLAVTCEGDNDSLSLSIENSTVKLTNSGRGKLEYGDYIYSAGNIYITESEIEVRGSDARIVASMGNFKVSGVSKVYNEGFIAMENGVLTFDLSPGGRVEACKGDDTSSVRGYNVDEKPPIVLGSGVKIIEPAEGYIFVNEDNYADIITGDSSGEIKQAQYSQHVIIVNEPEIFVTVNPAEVTLKAGGTQQFTAKVSGGINPSQEVTWSVSGNKSGETKINASGVLAVASSETATALIVKATAVADTTKSDTANVKVTYDSVKPPVTDPDNPDTGVSAPVLALMLLTVCGTLIMLNRKKQDKA